MTDADRIEQLTVEVAELRRVHLAEMAELRVQVAALMAGTIAVDTKAVGRLRDCIEGYFGPASFTTAGVVDLAERGRAGFPDAVAGVVDMNAEPHARRTALGLFLARQTWLVRHGERRGARLYRLRVTDDGE